MNQTLRLMYKFLFLFLLAVSITGCETTEIIEPIQEESTILGRWVLEGFEDNIRYDFTETRRFTIYGTDGEFPSLIDFQSENPDLKGHSWEYEGDVLAIDLNFGNFSRLIPDFKCSNQVVDFLNEEGEIVSTLFREGHSLSSCR